MSKYDVFISFKHSDENGNETRDYHIAKELYNTLKKHGYNTFFSTESLEEIGSSRYKNDIDNALDDVKVMIVVLTKAEYATSHWVQYEWDSYYGDYLSGIKKDAHLFTLLSNINIAALPRTLRNVQSFNYPDGVEHVAAYLSNILSPSDTMTCQSEHNKTDPGNDKPDEHFVILTGKEITPVEIQQALDLDAMVYEKEFLVPLETCIKWFEVNPDIYVMVKDKRNNKVIGYINISPITDESYEKIRSCKFIDTGITDDMILSYDMPFPYSVYFSSVVIHPDYQNSSIFMQLFNAVVDKFITLGKQEVYIKRMIADAVTANGIKFCKLFGMKKVDDSNHHSTVYEITMIPPQFKILSKKTKQLFDYYHEKYQSEPYLFD